MNKVCLIGYFPPPVHGISIVTQAVKEKLNSIGCEPYIIDLSTGGLSRSLLFRLSKFKGLAKSLLGFIRWLPGRSKRTVYLTISGKYGQLFDLLFLLLARVAGAKIYIHHHSFQYINDYFSLTQLLLGLAGPQAEHIVLCNHMGCLLKDQYGRPALQLHVLSNAAFINSGRQLSIPEDNNTSPLHIGFLSNIAKEKGIDSFLDLVEAANKRGLMLQATIAGPFQDQETEQRVLDRVNHLGGCLQYIGPKYKGEKHAFLASLDVLLFPTKYIDEAAPLVIYEALANGVPVIAKERGSIRSIIKDGAGFVFSDSAFEASALSQLRLWSENRDVLNLAKKKAHKYFYMDKDDADANLEYLCFKMLNVKSLP